MDLYAVMLLLERHPVIATLCLTAALIGVTGVYAYFTLRMARSTEKLAKSSSEQGEHTEQLAIETARLASLQVQQLNMLERQLHAAALDELRTRTRSMLLNSTAESLPRHVNDTLLDWIAEMEKRARSLPVALQDAIADGWALAKDVAPERKKLDDVDDVRRFLAHEIGRVTLLAIEQYWLSPGSRISKPSLPDVGSDYEAWLENHGDSTNSTPDT